MKKFNLSGLLRGNSKQSPSNKYSAQKQEIQDGFPMKVKYKIVLSRYAVIFLKTWEKMIHVDETRKRHLIRNWHEDQERDLHNVGSPVRSEQDMSAEKHALPWPAEGQWCEQYAYPMVFDGLLQQCLE